MSTNNICTYPSLGRVLILEINLYWSSRRKITRCRWDEKRAGKWSVLMIYEFWRVMEETAKIEFRFHIYLKAQQPLYIRIHNNQPRESNIQRSISRKLSSCSQRNGTIAMQYVHYTYSLVAKSFSYKTNKTCNNFSNKLRTCGS